VSDIDEYINIGSIDLDEASDLDLNLSSLDLDDEDLLEARISSDRPAKPVHVPVLKEDNLFHPSQVTKRQGRINVGTQVPGQVGSVSFSGPINRPIQSSSPISFMEETLKLRQLRQQPVASVVQSAPAANITMAAESGAEAAGQAVRTSSGASVAVKNYIKNKLDSASGASVIKKFANRKSIIYGSVAAVGLATSISASKNSLNNKENDIR
jgi:hypothetical protein